MALITYACIVPIGSRGLILRFRGNSLLVSISSPTWASNDESVAVARMGAARKTDSGVAYPPKAATDRSDWIDLIKATSVILVVQMHFVLSMLEVTGSEVTGFWHAFITVLEPFRMPTFFLVSGMLAAGAINRGWGTSRKRTLGTMYLYVLWSLILAGTMLLTLPLTGLTMSPGTVLTGLLFPADGYWYLLALVVFFVVAKAARNVPVWLVLGLAAVPNILRPETQAFFENVIGPFHSPGMLHAIALNLVFFLIGAYHKQALLDLGRAARWPLVALLGGAGVLLSLIRFNNPDTWGNQFFLLCLLWIATGIMAASLIARYEHPRRFAHYVGARTLPIFVLQFPLIFLTKVWLAESGSTVLDGWAAQALYPIVAPALVVAAALVLYRVAMASNLRFLFEAPQWAIAPGRSGQIRLPVRTPKPTTPEPTATLVPVASA